MKLRMSHEGRIPENSTTMCKKDCPMVQHFSIFSLRWQYRGEGNSVVVVLAIILVLIVSAGLF